MSKKNIIILCSLFNLFFVLSKTKFPDYINRHNNYKGYFDCFNYNNSQENSEKIETADDCFEESPLTKWKCCYFEYNDSKTIKNGCMRARKDNETDLNDLKYFVSKLSPKAVFNCKQTNLSYSFGILIGLLLFLF